MHRLKMSRNKVLNQNPPGSFSYYSAADDPILMDISPRSSRSRSFHPSSSSHNYISDKITHRNDLDTLLWNRQDSRWTSRVSPRHRHRHREYEYYRNEPERSVSPSRVSKEEIESMSDAQLASLVRQQSVQIEDVPGEITGAIENNTAEKTIVTRKIENNDGYKQLYHDTAGWLGTLE